MARDLNYGLGTRVSGRASSPVRRRAADSILRPPNSRPERDNWPKRVLRCVASVASGGNGAASTRTAPNESAINNDKSVQPSAQAPKSFARPPTDKLNSRARTNIAAANISLSLWSLPVPINHFRRRNFNLVAIKRRNPMTTCAPPVASAAPFGSVRLRIHLSSD